MADRSELEPQLNASAMEVMSHRSAVIDDALEKLARAVGDVASLEAHRAQKDVAQIATHQTVKDGYDAQKAA